ncbi:MAG: hypothetical protein HRT70_06925 [Flavobacteriaceae bacterium]|nr:hypothetical protein [Flavobacteriaceae bacterium]
MGKKGIRLRDSFGVIYFTDSKQSNGDISRTIGTVNWFRCNATHRETELIDRVYDVPQFKFDYVLRVRMRTLEASFLKKGSIVYVDKASAFDYFKVTSIVEDSNRTARIFVVAAD